MSAAMNQISRANGMTPLMQAVCDDSVDVVRALLDGGADVNEKRHDGFTALTLAAFFGRTRIVEVLLERGADVRVVTRFGTSPEMWAKARGFREIVDLLQGVSETASTSDNDSATPEIDVVVTPTPKTLPEIEDLPLVIGPTFHPGRAFIARINSDKRSLAVLTVALIVMVGLAILATYQIRSLLTDDVRQTASPDNNLPVQPQAAITQSHETGTPPQESAPQQSDSSQVPAVDVPNTATTDPNQESTTPATMVKPSIRILPTPRLSHSSVSTLKRDTVIRSEQSKQIAESETDLKPAPLTVEVSHERISPAPATRAADPPPVQPAPLGITSSKPRTKVIQWP